MKILKMAIVATILNLVRVTADTDSASVKALQDIQNSHIEGNIPNQDVFEKYMERDLVAYFSKKNKEEIKVEYEYLRNGPTQSGVSYPKYYLWVVVKVKKDERTIDAGAVRVQAIDKKIFEVTNYLSKKEIQDNGNILDSVFPKGLNEAILIRSKEK